MIDRSEKGMRVNPGWLTAAILAHAGKIAIAGF
jgi:hypothetical protein